MEALWWHELLPIYPHTLPSLAHSRAHAINTSLGAGLRQGLRVTQEVGRQGLRVAEEATREAELRASVLNALQTGNYEGLTVAEVTEKLDDLSLEELAALRELEKRNKDRESLIERIDSKIKADA